MMRLFQGRSMSSWVVFNLDTEDLTGSIGHLVVSKCINEFDSNNSVIR